MRWFKRTVVLWALALVLTPARAEAWFEWLDYLSGPGRWYGFKMDVRVWCSGPKGDWKGLRGLLDQAIADTLKLKNRQIPQTVASQWTDVLDRLEKSHRALPITDTAKFDSEIGRLRTAVQFKPAAGESDQAVIAPLDVLKIGEDLHRVLDVFERGAASIASTGIFVSLCKNDRTRAFAVEVGFTTLQANSNPNYAGDHSIRMNTINAGLSYRFPLPPDRDIIDVGTNVGMYHFSSRGFDSFSGLIVEPVYIDLHGPTRLVDAGGLKQLGGLITVRLSLVMFPGGFDAAQFASAASKPPRISGREVTKSATVFFNLTPLLWRRPKSTVPTLAAGVQ
jgi:hypothetical protein